MHPRNVVLMSFAFIIFGFLLLMAGVVLLVSSGKYSDYQKAEARILLVTGRVACVAGSLLMFSTLGTCLYLWAAGAQYASANQPYYSATSSQMSKVTQPRKTPALASAARAAGHVWSVDEKFSGGDAPSRSMNPKAFIPAGDISDNQGPNRTTNFQWKADVPPLDLATSTNWSNSMLNRPRFPRHRRNRSLDTAGGMYNYMPNLPLKSGLSPMDALNTSLGNDNKNRLWMPTLTNQISAFAGFHGADMSDFGGGRLEPLGQMLHTGRQILLGSDI
ncbi:unnamed protein product [Calicophoron daubneyi]|uniref:Uncharacterized protein n=1 Tax=Calicophoron daubneyi TaxID=300641 RepID=A0AAV2TMS8_CALDB